MRERERERNFEFDVKNVEKRERESGEVVS